VVELHLFDGGYAGLLLQEDGAANLCVSVERSRFALAGGPAAFLQQLMRDAPLLGERIRSDLPTSISAVAGVPYGWRARTTTAGAFRLGDQGAVIASIAGDGIAMALTSGQSAGETFAAGGPDAAQPWQRAWARQCRSAVVLAETFRRAAQAPMTRGAAFRALGLLPGLAAVAARLTRIDRRFSATARP
jgi:flavin-dependent dehydrogenase